MAKKKSTQKKHKFKHVEASQLTTPAVSTPRTAAVSSVGASSQRPALATPAGRDFRYVGGDMRRIGVAAVLLVAIELVLYYLLTMTSVGAAIYNLVQV